MIDLYIFLENLFNGNMLYAFASFLAIIGAVITIIVTIIKKCFGNN